MRKNIIIFIVLICVLAGIVLGGFLLIGKKENNSEIVKKESVSLCYRYSKKTDRGFYDKFWLKVNIAGNEVTGEFQSLPAEKDSKIGSFTGMVGPLDQKAMARMADVWWDSFAEGMQVKEELRFSFGDGSAQIVGGEMIDRGDGVYVYKDKTKPIYGFPTMTQISCEDLDEINAVEKYVRDNIKTIATNKPVLGGSWYTTAVFINYTLNEGTVTYEDGHIESKANFTYAFDLNTKNTTITKFEVQK